MSQAGTARSFGVLAHAVSDKGGVGEKLKKRVLEEDMCTCLVGLTCQDRLGFQDTEQKKLS